MARKFPSILSSPLFLCGRKNRTDVHGRPVYTLAFTFGKSPLCITVL